jgi:hypothetical protein
MTRLSRAARTTSTVISWRLFTIENPFDLRQQPIEKAKVASRHADITSDVGNDSNTFTLPETVITADQANGIDTITIPEVVINGDTGVITIPVVVIATIASCDSPMLQNSPWSATAFRFLFTCSACF